jgi:hypothetical protein
MPSGLPATTAAASQSPISPARAVQSARITLFFSACVYCGWVKIWEKLTERQLVVLGRERSVDHHVQRPAEEHRDEQEERQHPVQLR